MRELLRTSDPVLVSFVEALLKDARIDYHVADLNTSAVEGSIAIFPRRMLVTESQEGEARSLLADAGLGGELTQAAPQGDEARPADLAGGAVPTR